MNPHEYEPENCPDIPEEVVDGDDAENNEDPDMAEVMKVSKDTPIYVNTQSGRGMMVQFTENCVITATLREDETTAEVAEVLTSLVLTMAATRYRGVQETLDELRDSQRNMEVA